MYPLGTSPFIDHFSLISIYSGNKFVVYFSKDQNEPVKLFTIMKDQDLLILFLRDMLWSFYDQWFDVRGDFFFVDIGGTVTHHCLNILFIINLRINFLQQEGLTWRNAYWKQKSITFSIHKFINTPREYW